MDKPLPKTYLSILKFKSLSKLLLIAGIFVIAIFILRNLITSSLTSSEITVKTAVIGDIEATLTASGIVVAEYEQVIVSSDNTSIEKVLYNSGEAIKAGEVILTLNSTLLNSQYEKMLYEYQLLKNRQKQLELNLERNFLNLNTELNIKNLKLKSLSVKLEQEKFLNERKMNTNGDLEQAELNLEIAKMELNLLNKQITNQKNSQLTDMEELVLQIKILDKNLAEIKDRIDKAEVKSDRDGVITGLNNRIGSSVLTGEVLVKIADLNSYKVAAKIPDIHIGRLQIGTPVIVRVNDRTLRGKISSIDPTIKNSSVDFSVELEQKNFKELRSNMTAEVFVITAEHKNVVTVENGAFYNGSKKIKAFVLENGTAYRRDVEVGLTNFDCIEIVSGITAGEKVIISDTREFEHRKEIKIK